MYITTTISAACPASAPTTHFHSLPRRVQLTALAICSGPSEPTAQPHVAHVCDPDEWSMGGCRVGMGPRQATGDSSSIDDVGRRPGVETDGDEALRPGFRSKEEKLARQKERQKVADARAKEAASNPLHGFGLPDGDGGWPVSLCGHRPNPNPNPDNQSRCDRVVVSGLWMRAGVEGCERQTDTR